MEKVEFVEYFKDRTKKFAVAIINYTKDLPQNLAGNVLGRQLLRSATSVAANYRAACRARSKAEFFSKMSIVVEEADETAYWLELMLEANIGNSNKINELHSEATEILKVVAKARKNAR